MIRNFVAGKLLSWQRFWTLPDRQISLGHDGQGFLDDPEDEWGKLINPNVHALNEFITNSCVVLTGQPGIGKTTEVDALTKSSERWLTKDETLIKLNGRLIDSPEELRRKTVDNTKWESALKENGKIRLLIDAVDEGLVRFSTIVPALVEELKDQPLERIKLILVCRSAEWHLADGENLAALWDLNATSLVYELCPLRWKDVELASVEYGVDPQAFWKELTHHNVKGLAARPITLGFLLKEMKVIGKLPGNHHELFSNAIRRICEEDDERSRFLPPSNPTRPPVDQIIRVAGRIAMLMMVGGRNAVVRSIDHAENSELSLDEIETGDESIGNQRFTVTRELVKITLDTLLFSSRGHDKYGFDHQTFAEHLAAEYLSSCPLPQLCRLLTVTFDGNKLVAPQLAEIAARIAATNAAWCDHLIDTEPGLLLRADASPLSEDQRKRALQSILLKAKNEEIFDEIGTGSYYHTFQHAGVAEQLKPYIENPNHNPVVRRIALDIVGDANVAELEPLLWERIEAGDSASGLICNALLHLKSPLSQERLHAALRGEIPNAKTHDLKDLALHKLLPEYLSVSDVLPYLTPPPQDYSTFAYGIAKHLTVDDLPSVLKKMGEGRFTGSSSMGLGELAARAFEMAMENISDPTIAKSLAQYWRAQPRGHYGLPSRELRAEANPLIGLEDNSKRRSLAKLILTLPEATPNDLDRWGQDLMRDEDTIWLLEELPNIPENQRVCWARVCAWKVWRDLPAVTENLLKIRYAEFPELRAALPKIGHHDIAVTIKRSRKAHNLWNERRQKRNLQAHERRTRSERIDAIWAEVETNDTFWVGFCDLAFQPEKNDPEVDPHSDRSDITHSPAWRKCDESQQIALRVSARRFLVSRSDDNRERGTWTNWSDAACFGIGLLKEDLDCDAELREAVKARWPIVLCDSIDYNSASQKASVAAVYRLVPDTIITHLSRKLREDMTRGMSLNLSLYTDCWNVRLSEVLREFLIEKKINTQTIRFGFLFLNQHDQIAAIRLFDEMLLKISTSKLTPNSRAILSVGLFLLDSKRWEIAWAILLKLSDRMCRKIFLEAAHDYIYRNSSYVEKLTTPQLIAATSKIWKLFPSKEYDLRHSANGNVSADHMMPDLRETVTRCLINRATEDSCAGLRLLATEVPIEECVWIKWRHNEAVKNALLRIWTARSRSSADLLKMTRDSNTITIDSCDDLLEAVIESLQRLQKKIHVFESAELRALWNEPLKAAPTPKNEAMLSDVINGWLQNDLGPKGGIVLNREVQATKNKRLDIKVEAFSKFGELPLTVVVEVKGDWHDEIETALGDQLAAYLSKNHWTHGVYLVGWFGLRKPSSKQKSLWPPVSVNEAKRLLATWKDTQCPVNLKISPLLLECILQK